MRESEPRAQALLYLQTLFGERRGHLRFVFGVGPYFDENNKYQHERWQERHCFWPEHRDRFLDEAFKRAETDDVYLCPFLGTTNRRKQGSAKPSSILYADDADPATCKGTPFMLVDSGGGAPGESLHAYAILTETLESPELMAGNRRLRTAVRGDSKVSDNDVLRLPGTINHKTGHRVQLLQLGTAVPLDSLNLPRDAPSQRAAAGEPSTVAPAASLDPRKLPPLIRFRLNERSDDDRSRQTASFVRDCIEEGLSDEDTAAAVLLHRPTRERGKSRDWIVKDVRRLLGKAER